MNMDLKEHVHKYNKLNGRIKRYFRKNVWKEVKLRICNAIVKPALQYGCETWVLSTLLSISLRDKQVVPICEN
jgi:hypothetical protein